MNECSIYFPVPEHYLQLLHVGWRDTGKGSYLKGTDVQPLQHGDYSSCYCHTFGSSYVMDESDKAGFRKQQIKINSCFPCIMEAKHS
jgi:hypothetical protein